METKIHETELTALFFALTNLWRERGGQGYPSRDWQQAVLQTVWGEDVAEPLPTAHLPGDECAWREAAVQEAVEVLEQAVTANGKRLVCLGTLPLSLLLDPTDEATLTVMEAADDLRWTAPLIWALLEYHKGRLFQRLVRRCVAQLSRMLAALEQLEGLEEPHDREVA